MKTIDSHNSGIITLRSSHGKTTNICNKCQEDILNSNRLMETRRDTDFMMTETGVPEQLKTIKDEDLEAKLNQI